MSDDTNIKDEKDENNRKFIQEIAQLFSGELNPVAPKAQKKVPIPEGLDLDVWINEPPSSSESESENEITDGIFIKPERGENKMYQTDKNHVEPTQEEIEKMREARKLEQLHNPHYLKGSSHKGQNSYEYQNSESYENIPIAELNLTVPLKVSAPKRSDKYLNIDRKRSSNKKKKSKKSLKSSKKRHSSISSSDNEETNANLHVVNTTIEMPEGAVLSDTEDNQMDSNDPHRALDIDLDLPLRDDEVLPSLQYKNKDKRESGLKKDKKLKKAKTKVIKEVSSEVNLMDPNTPTKKKSRKVKKDKKDKKKTKEGKKEKLEYEEACGISTPSKEFQEQ